MCHIYAKEEAQIVALCLNIPLPIHLKTCQFCSSVNTVNGGTDLMLLQIKRELHVRLFIQFSCNFIRL